MKPKDEFSPAPTPLQELQERMVGVFEAYNNLAKELAMQNLEGNISITLPSNTFDRHIEALGSTMRMATKDGKQYEPTMLKDIGWFKLATDYGSQIMFYRRQHKDDN